MAEHGSVWWTELMTRDPVGAADFYREIFGWTPLKVAMGDITRAAEEGEPSYTLFMRGDTPACGAFKMEGPDFEGIPPHWFTYIAVDDVDAAVKTTVENGGQVMREPFDVPSVGRIAIVRDPEGVAIGMGTPAAETS